MARTPADYEPAIFNCNAKQLQLLCESVENQWDDYAKPLAAVDTTKVVAAEAAQ